ncbi:MAG: polymerase sigma factor, sigma-70 family [Bacillales bacterium]|nr:polymerase sigma factor, sigma-70 family [Bacillales bacterium]
MIQTFDDKKISDALEKYSDMVRRISYMYLRNKHDVEDVFQEVFLKLLTYEKPFESESHEKAWIIRVAINKCKDLSKSFWRKNTQSLEGVELTFNKKEESELMDAVLSLPVKYKDVIYLHYYEGYSVPEMSVMLNQKENTIYSNLHRARALLKNTLGEYAYEQSF